MELSKSELINDLRITVQKGVGATTLLEVLLPALLERQERLLTELIAAEPKLDRLLDVRAKISANRDWLVEIKRMQDLGLEATEVLERIVNK